MKTKTKFYHLDIIVDALQDGQAELQWNAYINESCSRNADIRTHRRDLLEAVIETARRALAQMDVEAVSGELKSE